MAAGIQRSAGIFALPKAVSLPGAKLYFYQTGTSTPVAVYTDLDLGVAHTQPVEADAAGVFPPIYIDGSTGDLRVSHYTSADVLIYTVDDYPASLGTTSSIDVNATNNPLIQLVQAGAAANQKVWYIHVEGQQFKLSLVNDAFSSEGDFMVVSRSANTATQVDFSSQRLTFGNADILSGDFSYKSATETRNTTTTLTADAELVATLAGGSRFLVEFGLFFYATTTAAMGFKFDVAAGGGAALLANGRAGPMIQHVNGTGAVATLNAFPVTPVTFGTISTSSIATDSVQFSVLASNSSTGTIGLRWAQNSSSGNNLNLANGSWVRATRLG